MPWRRLAIYTLVGLAILGGVAAYAIPRIGSSKEEGAERERAAEARERAARRRELVTSQRAQHGRRRAPERPLAPAAERTARSELLREVELVITADAQRRAGTGELRGGARRTECEPAPSAIKRVGGERDLSLDSDAYDCLAVTSEIPETEAHGAGALGHPFRAVIDFRRFTFAWCKTNPAAGERAVPEPRDVPELPAACRIR